MLNADKFAETGSEATSVELKTFAMRACMPQTLLVSTYTY